MARQTEKCALRWCESDKPGIVEACENIGDGAWSTMICEDCARALCMPHGGDLPAPHIVQDRLRTYYRHVAEGRV